MPLAMTLMDTFIYYIFQKRVYMGQPIHTQFELDLQTHVPSLSSKRSPLLWECLMFWSTCEGQVASRWFCRTLPVGDHHKRLQCVQCYGFYQTHLPAHIGKPTIKDWSPAEREFYCNAMEEGDRRLAQVCLPELRCSTESVQEASACSAGSRGNHKAVEGLPYSPA